MAQHRSQAAIAQAAHDTLVTLFPSQAPSFDALLATDLAEVPNTQPKSWRRRSRSSRCCGDPDDARQRRLRSMPSRAWVLNSSQATSRESGARIRSARGPWRSAPIGAASHRLSWTRRNSFARRRRRRLNSAAYAMAFDEVKRLGGDGVYDADGAHRGANRDRRLLGL